MKKALLYCLVIICMKSKGQQSDLKFCGTDEIRIASLKDNHALIDAVTKREKELNAFTKKFTLENYKKAQSAAYIIPVVFHIIHNYGSENISDAQVYSAIDVLNKYYRKQMSDTSAIVGTFKPLHADCEIEFRLAKKDPNGNCTKGINRIASAYTYTGTHDVKNLIHWEPTKYLNIYVVANAAGLAGHCVMPSDADTIPAWDGIVISHNYVGEIGTSSTLTRVTLSHEVGHYFNLQHTWGGNNVPGYYFLPCADPNKDCSIDDGVSDTPVTIGWQTCNLNGASCGSALDNVQNFMEYSYCNKMFTYGQKARMHACLNSSIAGRNNLWQTSNLVATGVDSSAYTLCAADFNYNKSQICSGSSVVFSDASYNTPIATYSWTFPGGSPSSSALANPTIVYGSPGIYSASLTVTDSLSNSVSITKNNIISVIDATATALPFSESFESAGAIPNANWSIINVDGGLTWSLNPAAAFSGTKSIFINNFNNTASAKDEVLSSPIDLSGSTAANIRFKYAYAQKSASSSDKLSLSITGSCDGNWAQRFSKQGTGLATTSIKTSDFAPLSGEWLEGLATVPSSYLTNGFRMKFVFENGGGNNVYVDNINIETPEGVYSLSTEQDVLKMFPNPAANELLLNFMSAKTGMTRIIIYDVCGRVCYAKDIRVAFGENNFSLDLSLLGKGAYVLEVLGRKSRLVKAE